MNELTKEQRAEIYEKAVELSRVRGQGVEQCMVVLERLYYSQQAWNDWVDQFRHVCQEWLDGVIDAMRGFQDLWDEMEAIPRDQYCASHGQLLRGGRCKLCDRVRH